MREELLSLRWDDAATSGRQWVLFREAGRKAEAARLQPAARTDRRKATLHGHCHQKILRRVQSGRTDPAPDSRFKVETAQSSCDGRGSVFGYRADTYHVSMQMPDASLLPAVRRTDAATLKLADGTCAGNRSEAAARATPFTRRLLVMSVDVGSSGS